MQEPITKPTPRKRFQFHLSTAIVMMFVAGGLMWANVTERREQIVGNFFSNDIPVKVRCDVTELMFLQRTDRDLWQGYREWNYGWPYTAMLYQGIVYLHRNRDMEGWKDVRAQFNYPSLIINVVVALTALFAVWFLCEWLIRRRAARKGA